MSLTMLMLLNGLLILIGKIIALLLAIPSTFYCICKMYWKETIDFKELLYMSVSITWFIALQWLI
jgi:hypothetical protein